MESTESIRTERISVQLPNETTVKVEVVQTGREDVAFGPQSFREVTNILEGIAEAISSTIQKVKPHKATVKFGLEMALESGQLTAVIVKGSGKGNLEITLEW